MKMLVESHPLDLQKRLVRLTNRAKRACRRISYVRKARLYCVGTAKSGTHSIASMWDDTVRAQHEAQSAALIGKITEIARGEVSNPDVRRYIRGRDRRLKLDVDSSQLNFFLLDYLLEEFRDAQFLLTVRDCYSWLDSFINDSLRREARDDWLEFRAFRFRADQFQHPLEELALMSKGLYTLDGYLSYWSSHNEKVLAAVPAERLLIVKTNDITKRADEIAEFAGLPTASIRAAGSHSFKNPHKFSVLGELDRDYLESKIRQHCSRVMERLFPEIRSIDDVDVV